MLMALERNDWGAGTTIAAMRERRAATQRRGE
jgi:hypothetical protein